MKSGSVDFTKRRSVSFHVRKHSVTEIAAKPIKSRRHSIAVPKLTETENRKMSFNCLDENESYEYICSGSREIYRRFQFELHNEKEREKEIELKKEKLRQRQLKETQKEDTCENENKLISFIVFIATEHENLMQLLIFSPLIIMSAYILFIEQGDLYHFVNENGR